MRKPPNVAEMNATGWMHIYPQGQWHMPAEIRGTTEALTALRDALTKAIEGDGTSEATAYAMDGEGYAVQIRRVNVLNLLGPLPYDGIFGDDRRNWADERHEAWKSPPEPFDPEAHRVIVYVSADGQFSDEPSPSPLAAEGKSEGER